jgi:uncharacterized protein (DUF305 family)
MKRKHPEMRNPFTRLTLALCVIFAAAAPALAQQPPGAKPMQEMPGHQGMMREHGGMPNTPGAKAMMDSMHRMQQGMMGKPMTGDADHDFATMMREHHKGAIDMARVELEHGKDTELKSLAQKVIEDQSREIKQLDEWLERHPMGPGRK